MKTADKAREHDAAKIDGTHGVWSIPEWCEQFGCSAPYFYYSLKPAPRQVRLGRKVRITESPADYVERVRALHEGHSKRDDQEAR